MRVTKNPSIAISSLTGTPRQRIETARALGARAVLLDASLPGVRPRELDRSARRGLCALLRRMELRLDGAELPIPAPHFADPATQDRALAAVAETSAFLAEAAALAETTRLLHLAAPDPQAAAAAAPHDITLTAPAQPDLPQPYSAALDLGAVVLAGSDPVAAVGATPKLGAIRLTDARNGARCALGHGDVDVFALHAAAATVAPEASLIIDTTNLPDARAAAEQTLAAWADAARPLL